MRKAMADSDVGDDVYGEDPTVNELEAKVAGLFGVAAALFVPSGTMGNQIALRLICKPAQEVICDADAHVVTYEGGGAAQHGGLQTRTIVAERGLLSRDAVEQQIRPEGFGTVPTSALAVEQTHNRGGGAVYPLSQLKDLRALTSGYDVALHCDGARIWNAHVASDVPLSEYGALFDTMSVCLSKGLGAPVGSLVLVADGELIPEARAIRRRLGGGMRQAGVLAAAGLYAVRNNIQRLADDHDRARRLASALADLNPALVAPQLVETNIVAVDLSAVGMEAATVAAACRADGLLVSVVGARRMRLVTHLDIDDEAVDRAVTVVSRVLAAS
jgi:threonine aldolase